MAFPLANAEASSSMSPRVNSARWRNSVGGLSRTKSPTVSLDRARSPTIVETDRMTSPQSHGVPVKQDRKIRTIPPSAIYEPPTPPSPPHQPLPLTTAPSATKSRKRRRLRMHYSTSESSSDESGSSDEDPPWWTFTNRGMAKMRERSERWRGDAHSAVEDGKDERRGSHGTISPPQANFEDWEPDSRSPRPASSLQHPLPILQHGQLLRQSSALDLPKITLPSAPARDLVRRNSAPTSPLSVTDNPSPGMTTLVADTDEPSHSRGSTAFEAVSPVRLAVPKRQMTAPTFPRGFKAIKALTDSETHSPRPPVRSRMSRGPKALNPSTEDGSDTPTRDGVWSRGRRQTHKLRLNLPPPITNHFSHGWPQAGSWQDALHGHYGENSDGSRRSSNHEFPPKPAPDPLVRKGSEPTTPMGVDSERRRTGRRSRSRRSKRYRQALIPPTPAGLGFTPSGIETETEAWKEGRIGGHGFDWEAPGRRMDIEEEADGLSRFETRLTNTEKGETAKQKTPWWSFSGSVKKVARQVDDTDWRKRGRRMLFLDARVTIWIRALNLVVSVILLALAISIRRDLYRLDLAGLIGSSTVLIIIYSCPTIIHVLTAIYREYFGKPIGLWGLRSKMLWVCLDLLFVSLWSSAMSLATNDYISTPLECTQASPWWRSTLANDYKELLTDLRLLDAAANGTTGAINVSTIAYALGVVLPTDVVGSHLVRDICGRQAACITLALLALIVYGGNMVLSLFRIFETVRRSANIGRAVTV